MGNFYNDHEHRRARKEHRCTYCGEMIPVGEVYVYQTGVYEESWYTSKMHDECFDAMTETGEEEYMPYSNERPSSTKRVGA